MSDSKERNKGAQIMSEQMTLGQSIKECQEFWLPVFVGSARDKSSALDLLSRKKRLVISGYLHECPLCEYVWQKSNHASPMTTHLLHGPGGPNCRDYCPLITQLGLTSCQQTDVSWSFNPLEFAKKVMELKVPVTPQQ